MCLSGLHLLPVLSHELEEPVGDLDVLLEVAGGDGPEHEEGEGVSQLLQAVVDEGVGQLLLALLVAQDLDLLEDCAEVEGEVLGLEYLVVVGDHLVDALEDLHELVLDYCEVLLVVQLQLLLLSRLSHLPPQVLGVEDVVVHRGETVIRLVIILQLRHDMLLYIQLLLLLLALLLSPQPLLHNPIEHCVVLSLYLIDILIHQLLLLLLLLLLSALLLHEVLSQPSLILVDQEQGLK